MSHFDVFNGDADGICARRLHQRAGRQVVAAFDDGLDAPFRAPGDSGGDGGGGGGSGSDG